jgi:hypothetical protein
MEWEKVGEVRRDEEHLMRSLSCDLEMSSGPNIQ